MTAVSSASAVEPDVRVESQQTLSLGEDRTLLAANLAVEILRAGLFRLSFVLPPGFDIESLSGPAVSHWTELRTGEQRQITLHLNGKTEGRQSLNLSLTGPGLKGVTNWSVPRLLLREAGKQRGQLVIVPEQGLRLQVAARSGLTQLDPQKAGIRQKGVLAFRLLSADWTLGLDLEQVDSWVQVSSLQLPRAGYETRHDYVPALLWYTSIAQYREAQIDKNTLQRRFQDYFNAHRGEKGRSHQIGELLNELKPFAPEVLSYVQKWI